MACDFPVQADRADLSFARIFWRAPIVGSLFYLLAGRDAEQLQQEEDEWWGPLDHITETNQLSHSMINPFCQQDTPSLIRLDSTKTQHSCASVSSSEDTDHTATSSCIEPRERKRVHWADIDGDYKLVTYI